MQDINFAKSDSELFVSPNINLVDAEKLKDIFGVKCVDKPGTYFGANLDFTSNKRSLFNRALERIQYRLSSWKSHCCLLLRDWF